ncbi:MULTISPECIES: hypothetical protein [Yersinia]|uniref:hypothetical protein n=1 Tax=Yersinia TaxID=629 RepID=UPI0005DECEA4|nr:MULTISPECIES: hypothetical protein [Yersinia]MBS0057701.1 hypothetical protein [Yersinia sp. Marseille-Q3913]MBW5835514.1 hypothetical protein [Yersinia enterocolitica]CNL76097.1 Uncharacterised protein [Yersinia enterocolitica]
MTNTPFSELSRAFRARVVKTWIMSTDFSAAVGAEVLKDTGVKHDFVRRENPVLGSSLAGWAKDGHTPLWASQSALMLLLEKNWIPVSHEDWAGFAAIFIKIHRDAELGALLDSVPASIDRDIAAGWLSAAIEEDARYKVSKKKAKT